MRPCFPIYPGHKNVVFTTPELGDNYVLSIKVEGGSSGATHWIVVNDHCGSIQGTTVTYNGYYQLLYLSHRLADIQVLLVSYGCT